MTLWRSPTTTQVWVLPCQIYVGPVISSVAPPATAPLACHLQLQQRPPHPPCAGFRAAWRACPSATALKHLDVDAPRLMRGLYEQEVSGLWAQKPVQCSSGPFLPGDYSGWKRWRDSLPGVEHT